MIRIDPVIVRISPYGFYQYANHYANWAIRAHVEMSPKSYTPVPYFLYCRSIEVALKGFLLTKGLSQSNLASRALGHNLSVILAKAIELGLTNVISLDPTWEIELTKANRYYSRKGFEYFSVSDAVRAFPELPSLSVLKEFTNGLIQSLREVCLNAT